jgi:hypothetical protein
MLVTVARYCELSGVTDDAVRARIARGVWTAGREYHRDPLGRIMIDLQGVEAWVKSCRAESKSGEIESESRSSGAANESAKRRHGARPRVA